ncbi:hypothetical protein AB0N71_16605 [Pseudarthrobacter enclensis]|uniref:hypothetical protein n=1 Tax=Pseudarthrobacter enclensis TaxID=993070 RepID=UPI00342B441F
MPQNDYNQFLDESTTHDHTSGNTIGRANLYGLYLSWCNVNNHHPGTERSFWAGVTPRVGRSHNNGLRMKGLAAADFILNSRHLLI